jgi:signal transduction histidine kinase/ActR/RegA family two-component response regulator
MGVARQPQRPDLHPGAIRLHGRGAAKLATLLQIVETSPLSPATLPPDEDARLAALHSTGLLDAASDPTLNALVELAAHICQVPIALVSLVDRERQCFHVKVGLQAEETHRDVAFCAHAILVPNELFVVPDARLDPRFASNPLVLGDPWIRFYAGVPLVLESGHAIGTLCILDRQPRELDAPARKALCTLAKQVTAQITLRQRARQLESANQALRQAREEAEDASREMLRLTAFVGHEFRTPMTGILGMSSLLLQSPMPPEQVEMVETIESSSKNLLHLLNQLLDFSQLKIGHRELQRRPFDPLACADSAIDLVRIHASEKQIEVWVNVDPSLPSLIETDEDKLRQVFINLLGNAIKFSSGGFVRVELSAPRRHVLRVVVVDSGEGLSEELLRVLFQPFVRGEHRSPETPSTGLGLAICKQIVELQGGRIWADNAPGGGARFSFEIDAPGLPSAARPLEGVRALVAAGNPVRSRATKSRLRWWGATVLDETSPVRSEAELLFHEGDEAPLLLRPPRALVRLDEPVSRERGDLRALRWNKLLPRLAPRPGAQPPATDLQALDENLGARCPLRILLAEDHPVNRRVATKILDRLGYRVTPAANGQEVLDRFEADPFDVILMDLHMPTLDGLGVTRTLRTRGARVWIVATTASASHEDRALCTEAGMDDFLSKPILLEELVRVLHRAFLATRKLSSRPGEPPSSER